MSFSVARSLRSFASGFFQSIRWFAVAFDCRLASLHRKPPTPPRAYIQMEGLEGREAPTGIFGATGPIAGEAALTSVGDDEPAGKPLPYSDSTLQSSTALGAGLPTPPQPALGAGLPTPPQPALGAGLPTPPQPPTEGLPPRAKTMWLPIPAPVRIAPWKGIASTPMGPFSSSPLAWSSGCRYLSRSPHAGFSLIASVSVTATRDCVPMRT
jgi:hypothetical protein